MPSLKEIVPAALTPLVNANMAGLVIGAMWVGTAMQWPVIGIGIVVACFSSYIIPLLMIPVGVFSHFLMVYKGKKQKDREQLMFVLSVSYILLFLTLWCVGIFEFVTTRVSPDAARAAGLVWADSVAMLPLLMWINRDRGNIFIMTLVETAQIALLLLSAIRFVGIETSFWSSSAVFGGLLSLVAVLLAARERESLKNPAGDPH
ncbi:MAG: hypothetical protein V1721_04480 [Pseudomonadota bacterium]